MGNSLFHHILAGAILEKGFCFNPTPEIRGDMDPDHDYSPEWHLLEFACTGMFFTVAGPTHPHDIQRLIVILVMCLSFC